jgi:branched-chain amino acid transport system permease protein
LDLAQAVVSGLALGAVYALVAVGLTIVLGVMDIVNFAHGDMLTLAMYATYFVWAGTGLDPLLAIPVVAAMLALVGLVIYWACIRRVLRGPALSQIIVTFGLLVAMRGLMQLVFTANVRAVTNPAVGSMRLTAGGVVLGGPQLAAAVGAVACLLALGWFLTRTELGAAVTAVAQNRLGASLVGIDPNRIHALAWVLAGATVGVSGALLVNYYPVAPDAGAGFGLVAFVVVTLGGFGSLRGALVAGLLMGMVQDLVGLFAPGYGLAAIFLLYLLVVMVKPQGIFGGA